MVMVTIACCLWSPNKRTQEFSRCYNESWVEKLYRGFSRNLTKPFQFVVFTDRPRTFYEPQIRQQNLKTEVPHYGCLIEPFRLNVPMIMCGLDMVVLDNVDHMADYCLSAEQMACPRNPYETEQLINPVVLVPAGHGHIADGWRGENDMTYLRRFQCAWIDDMWPGHVVSLKAGRIRDTGPLDARIIYMHGHPKPNELLYMDWVRKHWR